MRMGKVAEYFADYLFSGDVLAAQDFVQPSQPEGQRGVPHLGQVNAGSRVYSAPHLAHTILRTEQSLVSDDSISLTS